MMLNDFKVSFFLIYYYFLLNFTIEPKGKAEVILLFIVSDFCLQNSIRQNDPMQFSAKYNAHCNLVYRQ